MKDYLYLIRSYKSKHASGFTRDEMVDLCIDLCVDEDLFFENLGVNTGLIVDGDYLTYKNDVELAFTCSIEGRDKSSFEFD